MHASLTTASTGFSHANVPGLLRKHLSNGLIHKGIKADIGVGPVPNTQMERMAAPSGIELLGFFFHPERENPHSIIPLLSAKDVKELVVFQLYKQMTDEQMYHKIIHRYIRRKKEINNAYLR